jgi:uncharacterized repeat protein (TIGR01451 family)
MLKKFLQRKKDEKTERKNFLKDFERLFAKNPELGLDAPVGEETNDETLIADMIEKKRARRRFLLSRFGIIGGAALLLAGIIGFFYFGQYQFFAEEKVAFSLVGPETAAVGETVTYFVKYANQGEIELKNVKLLFQTPTGLANIQTAPPTSGRSFELGNLAPGVAGEVKILGNLIAAPGSIQKLTATLIFVPNNFNSEFSEVKTWNTTLRPIDFAATFEAPTTTVPGEKINLELRYKNSTLENIPKIKIRLIAPAGFTLLKSEPKITRDDFWEITDFPPGAEKDLLLYGQFAADLSFANDGERTREFKFQFYSGDSRGEYLLQQEPLIALKIVDQALGVNLIVNGGSANRNVNWGDKLNFTIIYKNKGAAEIKNVNAAVVIDARPADFLAWEQINDPEFGQITTTDAGKMILWTRAQIPGLASLPAHGEGAIDFSLPIKNFADLQQSAVGDYTGSTLTARAILIPIDASQAELPKIETSPLILSLNSDLNFTNRAAYYFTDGTPLGSGPIPPTVDRETEYLVFWELKNKIHEVENITVSAVLPEQISWRNNFSISTGEVKYDEATRAVSWTINRLPTTSGPASLTFHLALKPTAADVGKLMKILNNATLTATDLVTRDTITITSNILTTNLETDKFGRGQGIVEP